MNKALTYFSSISDTAGSLKAKILKEAPQWRTHLKRVSKKAKNYNWRKGYKELADAVSKVRAPNFSLKEQSLFAKRLAFLINAGVPIVEALHVLRDQMKGRGHQVILNQIVNDVSSGQSLSRSMGKFPDIFGEFAIYIIKVGETSGTLFQNLNYLADELKKREILRRKIVGAFIYPIVITCATIGITVFLMVYLFPKITPIFASLHATLPLSTRIVMAMSNFLQHWGLWLFILLLIGGSACFYGLKKNVRFHMWFDWTILKLPVLGGMLQSYNVANGCRTLGLLLKSGVRFSEALSVTAETTKSLVYKKAYRHLETVVVRGDKISTHLAKRKDIFPDMMTHMLAVGERSGTLSDTLVYLSEMYDGEVDDFTKNLSTLIEPILMVIMGVLVGFIAISIITPIYGITQNLHG